MNIVFLIGRISFGGYWLMASFNHFKNLNYMSKNGQPSISPKESVTPQGVVTSLCR